MEGNEILDTQYRTVLGPSMLLVTHAAYYELRNP